MAFECSLEMTPQGIAKITLSGELDASVAQEFRDKVDEAANQKAKRLVLLMAGLEYAKQKMGAGVDIYVVAAQEPIIDTLTMTGFQHSVILMDAYDAATIEHL
jgi:anti-anti-sigma factor